MSRGPFVFVNRYTGERVVDHNRPGRNWISLGPAVRPARPHGPRPLNTSVAIVAAEPPWFGTLTGPASPDGLGAHDRRRHARQRQRFAGGFRGGTPARPVKCDLRPGGLCWRPPPPAAAADPFFGSNIALGAVGKAKPKPVRKLSYTKVEAAIDRLEDKDRLSLKQAARYLQLKQREAKLESRFQAPPPPPEDPGRPPAEPNTTNTNTGTNTGGGGGSGGGSAGGDVSGSLDGGLVATGGGGESPFDFGSIPLSEVGQDPALPSVGTESGAEDEGGSKKWLWIGAAAAAALVLYARRRKRRAAAR